MSRDITAGKHGGAVQSVESFQRIESTLPRRRAEVLAAIRRAGPRGATVAEVALALRRAPNDVSGRFSELKRDRLITQNLREPSRVAPDGRNGDVYVVPEHGGCTFAAGSRDNPPPSHTSSTRRATERGRRELEHGELPEGWSVRGWIGHLRHLADACAPYHPDKAEYYRTWADKVEATHNRGRA